MRDIGEGDETGEIKEEARPTERERERQNKKAIKPVAYSRVVEIISSRSYPTPSVFRLRPVVVRDIG
jgi:hypothetical protein